jgi:general secretion pathway protein D
VSQQVQYVNAGVTLQIAPRVSSDGYVTSHIFCVVSNVTGTSQGYPTISQREAGTSATVKDGDTFVIGGLTQESELKSKQKVPMLSDVPLMGQLFDMKSNSSSKSELFIVVTPHIIKRLAPVNAGAPRAPDALPQSLTQLKDVSPQARLALANALAASETPPIALTQAPPSPSPNRVAAKAAAEQRRPARKPAVQAAAAANPLRGEY